MPNTSAPRASGASSAASPSAQATQFSRRGLRLVREIPSCSSFLRGRVPDVRLAPQSRLRKPDEEEAIRQMAIGRILPRERAKPTV